MREIAGTAIAMNSDLFTVEPTQAAERKVPKPCDRNERNLIVDLLNLRERLRFALRSMGPPLVLWKR